MVFSTPNIVGVITNNPIRTTKPTAIAAIAAAAGVSPGLVIHHFGSKDNLHRACDEYIAETIRAAKSESIQTSDPATWLAQMAEIEQYAPMMAYLVRSLQDGGGMARELLEHLAADAEAALGPQFDLKAFHDVILAQGSVPLPVLEDEIRAFIARERTKPVPDRG